ncbi:MAG: aminotransferase class I/II-fold pyridoxal phosphate-dependent enzyme [Vampirovibrionales bacterium]|nr:aminotransferase class I/II-fold pyridoxal phosphate-dependent enzyme [Vampirovibrionales bacterium]
MSQPASTQASAFLNEGIASALAFIRQWQDYMPEFSADATTQVSDEHFASTWAKFSEKLADNYPFFHPLYAGQMLKPPHPAAVIGYLATMLINPNNHAMEGGPATSKMEKEVIAKFARRFGFGDQFLGHLTTSGTLANLEALWIAREIHPEKAIAYSAQAHYTHTRATSLLKTQGVVIPALPTGKMDVQAFKAILKKDKDAIGTVVATLGSTGLGSLDALDELVNLKSEYGFRIHVDMAYGGYYHLLKDTEANLALYNFVKEVDSLVIDPHKHGLQPYGCGCVLFKDPTLQRYYHHESPYTYLTATDDYLHLGEISLECSRSGAAAAALWMTLECFPLEDETGNSENGMGAILKKTLAATRILKDKIAQSNDYRLYIEPELNIINFFARAKSTSAINRRNRAIFHAAMDNADFPLFLALLKVSADDFKKLHSEVDVDSEHVLLLRTCLMKPEHESWADQIYQILHHHGQIIRDEA